MSDIQQARDVLKKWRDGMTSDVWATSYDPAAYPYSAFHAGYEVIEAATPGIARLAIGTAGNPDLLDAIDEGLRQYGTLPDRSVPSFIKRIAASIVAANEGMNA